MTCLYPVRIGLAEPSPGFWVPCGRCKPCQIQKAAEWATRITAELSYCDEACWITLTYSDKYLPPSGSLSKTTLQWFLRELRRKFPPKTLKYFANGEYGETNGRCHYHIVLLGIARTSEWFEKIWPYGNVFVGTVTKDSARYTAEYMLKEVSSQEEYGHLKPPFLLQSKGLGAQYADDNAENIKANKAVYIDGKPKGIPRYYKKRLEIEAEINTHAMEVRETFKKRGYYTPVEIKRAIIEAKIQNAKNIEARIRNKRDIIK